MDLNYLMRYNENEFSAVIGFNVSYGVVAMGFPFETITDEKSRAKLMGAILDYLIIEGDYYE
jgi:hypothetical protein